MPRNALTAWQPGATDLPDDQPHISDYMRIGSVGQMGELV